MLRHLLQVSDWMCSIDLKDTYLSVNIFQEHRRYLLCFWRETMYKFTCLPFGLCSAPRIFTKLMKPVIAFLQGQGIQTIIYLDDILIMNQSLAALQSQVYQTVSLLESLGFIINREKSQLVPSQQIRFLGFHVGSVNMKLFLPEDKIQQITQMCQDFIAQQVVSLRNLSQLLGKMCATTVAVLPDTLWYQNLQQLKIQSLRRSSSYNNLVTLEPSCIEELTWWSTQLHLWNGRDVRPQVPDMRINTDAKLTGWGAVCDGVCTGGLWSPKERRFHIIWSF